MIYDARLLNGLKVCHGMTGRQIDAFIEVCLPARVPAGTLLIGRGDDDRAMLFVREGDVEVFIGEGPDEIIVGELASGEHAGAMGLLGLTERRSASVRAKTACTLLILEPEGLAPLEKSGNPIVGNLEGDAIKGLIARQVGLLKSLAQVSHGQDPDELWPTSEPTLLERVGSFLGRRQQNRLPAKAPLAIMRSCPGLGEAPDAMLATLFERMRPQHVAAGDALALEGGDRSDAFLVLSGSVGRFRRSRRGAGHIPLGSLGPGSLAGFECMLDLSSPPATCVALEESVLLMVPRSLCIDAVFERSPMAKTLRHTMLMNLAVRLEEVTRLLLDKSQVQPAIQDTVPLDQNQMQDASGKASVGMF